MVGRARRAQRFLVTGATGFLGRATVEAALARGHAARAVGRAAASVDAAPWRGRAGVEAVTIDLGAEGARAALDAALDGVDAVIHAAAASGGDKAHARGTVAATETLIAAMTARPAPPRLTLVSSFSVYGYAAMPGWAQVDETTPLEPDPALRDAYCRAKLAQEALARRAAQRDGLRVRALRPGAIVGPERMRTARLGFAFGPLLVAPGGDAPIPLIDVADCAALIIRAAETDPDETDFPAISGDGRFEAINLVGVDQPAQSEFARRLRADGWPRATIRVPLRLARAPAQAIALAGLVIPGLARRAPAPLRLEAFDARFKPLRFSRARAEDRLGAEPDASGLEEVVA